MKANGKRDAEMEHGGQHDGMGQRGVTRMQHDGHDQMTAADRHEMQRKHHAQTLWVYVALILLGVWLILSPLTFGYESPAHVGPEVPRITAERGLPPIPMRATAMIWSDVVSGALLVVLGLLSLRPSRVWAPWAACFVGLWLLFAPLLFWSPVAAAYANDVIVGTLVVALSCRLVSSASPWSSYNPSPWAPGARSAC